ncbi:nucleophile aminohydrolase [Dipodascopsis uninucleata]
MCRFLIYKGRQPILLAHLLTRPEHSIINQSYDSRLRIDTRRPINGDGFGVGYYCTDTCDPELSGGPCVFCSTSPAWNNLNLARLAEKTKSSTVFAHVRASTSGVLSETNCHPFVYGSLMFMHNGQIANFSSIKRKFVIQMSDKFFCSIQGGTDSEWVFALFLDTLEKLTGIDPTITVLPDTNCSDQNTKRSLFTHTQLREAMLKTIAYIKDWTSNLEVVREASYKEPSLLNFALTDGNTVIVTRYITSRTEEAASLHFSTGSKFIEYKPGQYRMERHDRLQDVILVASEPLTFERNDWVTVPTNTILTINNQTVLLHPIVDEFYQSNPAISRSSDFASSRGLISPIVQPQASTNINLPPLEREGRRRVSIST